MWAPQIIEPPMVQVLAASSLKANNKYAELVLEVLLLGIIPSLTGSHVRLLFRLFSVIHTPLAYSKQHRVESLPNAGISLKGGIKSY